MRNLFLSLSILSMTCLSAQEMGWHLATPESTSQEFVGQGRMWDMDTNQDVIFKVTDQGTSRDDIEIKVGTWDGFEPVIGWQDQYGEVMVKRADGSTEWHRVYYDRQTNSFRVDPNSQLGRLMRDKRHEALRIVIIGEQFNDFSITRLSLQTITP